MDKTDVLVIGAGAAGLMCAIEAGKRKRRVLVLDHANKVGKKILMSGGGRCNFTNYYISPDKYISQNPHFCKSALSRYTQWDFIALVEKHTIQYFEKTKGQLFCVDKAKILVDMLVNECRRQNALIKLNTSIKNILKINNYCYQVYTNNDVYECESLVIATGGLSIPTMGASPFAYKIASQFGLNVLPTRAGLVPLTFDSKDKQKFAALSGVSLNSIVKNKAIEFHEDLLFTHRGLSGPGILQISSYMKNAEPIEVNLAPRHDIKKLLKDMRSQGVTKQLSNVLQDLLPNRVIDIFLADKLKKQRVADISNEKIEEVAIFINNWQVKPNGTEGYRTAEVTVGGIDTNDISSKTMECLAIPGLYFIGEALDVTGWLGGYNFQWAWSSGHACGQHV